MFQIIIQHQEVISVQATYNILPSFLLAARHPLAAR